MKYNIIEIFSSIQGEGQFTGTPVVFVRFAGCNKQCRFCDTEWKEENSRSMTGQEILTEVKKYNSKYVVFTGGEPALSLTPDLLRLFDNFWLHLETNGSIELSIDLLVYLDWITVSPKQALSSTYFKYANEIKFLYPYITEPSEEVLSNNNKLKYIVPIWTEDKKEYAKNLSSALAEVERLTPISKNVRLGVQLHKYLDVQ